MEKSFINTAIKAALSITEQNISTIEKIHNRYRFGRYLGRNLFLLTSLAIAIGYSFLIAKYFEKYYIIALLIPMISALMSLKIMDIIKSEVLKSSLLLYLNVSVGIAISYISIKLISGVFEENSQKLDFVIPFIFLFLLIIFMGFLFFYTSKNLADASVRSFMNKRYIVTIELVNSTIITGELLTITNKNDYILKTGDTNSEILLRNNSIASIKIDGEI